jgi:hypothetical protein
VQITGADNYERAGRKLGLDLMLDPDKALDPVIAARILYLGMGGGLVHRQGSRRFTSTASTRAMTRICASS